MRKHKGENGQIAKLTCKVTNHLENHLEDFPQRLSTYQDFLGSPDLSHFYVNTQSFLDTYSHAHIVVKPSLPPPGGW